MFSGECLTGIIIVKYQSKYLKGKVKNGLIINQTHTYFSFKKFFKIYGLLFMATFFDFIEFTISALYIKKYIYISVSLESRCYGVLAISNVLIYIYILKIPILKHQKLSIFIISTCFSLTIINEFCFQDINEFFTYDDFIGALSLILIKYFYLSMMDGIDKYLMEFEFFYQFKIIIAEGGFGTILTLLFCLVENPFNDIKKVYKSNSGSYFGIFIFMLVFYFAISGIRNAFRIMTNKLYSPMVLTLSDNISNPIQVIIDYLYNNDFKTGNSQNILYFTISLILSIITTSSTFIYNEFVVLFCCGFDYDTYYQITKRAHFEMIDMKNIKLNENMEIFNEKDNEDKERSDTIYY